MTRLRQGLIILVAGLFLVVVSVGGALAADKSKLPETKSKNGIKMSDQQLDSNKRTAPITGKSSTEKKRITILHKMKDDERTKPVKKDNQEGIAVIKTGLTD